MTVRKWLHVAGGVVLFGVLAVQSTGAIGDDRTYFTFSGPFRLPGVTLPAGTYRFSSPILDSSIVRVTNREGSQLYMQRFTRKVDRPAKGDHDSMLVFRETSEGTVPTINIWYPQGKRTGHQFVY